LRARRERSGRADGEVDRRREASGDAEDGADGVDGVEVDAVVMVTPW
jgi:hypothetical protein